MMIRDTKLVTKYTKMIKRNYLLVTILHYYVIIEINVNIKLQNNFFF